MEEQVAFEIPPFNRVVDVFDYLDIDVQTFIDFIQENMKLTFKDLPEEAVERLSYLFSFHVLNAEIEDENFEDYSDVAELKIEEVICEDCQEKYQTSVH